MDWPFPTLRFHAENGDFLNQNDSDTSYRSALKALLSAGTGGAARNAPLTLIKCRPDVSELLLRLCWVILSVKFAKCSPASQNTTKWIELRTNG